MAFLTQLISSVFAALKRKTVEPQQWFAYLTVSSDTQEDSNSYIEILETIRNEAETIVGFKLELSYNCVVVDIGNLGLYKRSRAQIHISGPMFSRAFYKEAICLFVYRIQKTMNKPLVLHFPLDGVEPPVTTDLPSWTNEFKSTFTEIKPREGLDWSFSVQGVTATEFFPIFEQVHQTVRKITSKFPVTLVKCHLDNPISVYGFITKSNSTDSFEMLEDPTIKYFYRLLHCALDVESKDKIILTPPTFQRMEIYRLDS